MSEEDDQADGDYGDTERIKAWLDGWGQYFWAVLALVVLGFLAWTVAEGLIH